MSSSTPRDTASRNPSLKRTLGLPSVVFFGLAYMVPLTVFTTYGIVTELTAGHLPAAYIVTTITMIFTAIAYANMVRAFPVAGSAYTYTQQSFGASIGFLAGWALLLDYLFLPMINYMVIGIYMSVALPTVPAWIWIVAAIVLVTVFNVLGIRLVASANMVLVGAQIAFIAVFLVMAIATYGGQAEPISPLAPFYSSEFDFSTILAGAAILCLSFLGFDAVSTLSEETKSPRKTIPRAILLCTVVSGLIYIGLSWLGHVAFPNWQDFTDADSAAVDVMMHVGGGFLTAFFTAAYVAGCVASAMASQVSVSRILFSMGRDGTLPRSVFGKVHQRFKTPYLASLVVGVVSLVALLISLELASSMISFGALIAFTFVNLSVIKHYAIDKGRRHGVEAVKYIVVPAIGVALCLWLWTSLSGTTFAVGLAWVALGVIHLLYLTRFFRRPAPKLDFSEADPEAVAGAEPARA
ncbi:amino acid permease [Brevibacterium daeguense]|uniref:Amino acid permease n=1 Tax=Brevibacterium daeguense TaxID=909936 RepID=A0ABP8EJR6_9MICO|nr:APC family permease [Brevibacterium daeguense]